MKRRKRDGKRPAVEIGKVLFTSGYTADIISKKGLLEEGLDFVRKPISPPKLLRKVREILNRHVD